MIGWVYEIKDIKEKVSIKSIIIYTVGFWILITVIPTMSLFAYHKYSWTTIIVQILSLPVLVFVSSKFSPQNTFKEWVSIVFFSGVRKIARHMTLLSNKDRKGVDDTAWWEPIFEYWFGFSIKYFMPTALVYCMMNTLRSDFKDRYGGYPLGTNFIGWSIVFLAIIMIVVPIFLCTEEEPFDEKDDKPFEVMAQENFDEQKLEKTKNQEKNSKDDEEEVDASNDKEKVEESESDTGKGSKHKDEVKA